MPSSSQPLADDLVQNSAVLDVQQSGLGKSWVWRASALDVDSTQRTSFAMAQQLGLSELTCRLLASRGVDAAASRAFLTPRLRDTLPDPSTLTDMSAATSHLASAISTATPIGILGDYDVDGGCGTALLTETVRGLGCAVYTHIPDRLTEGYGPNVTAIEGLIAKGARIIICIDCGTAAVDVIDTFAGRVPVIILDHHKPDGLRLPKAIVVNPNRLDCDSGFGDLCATSVVFLTLISVLRELRKTGFFQSRPCPDLLSKLDLVALATICDVMPLRGLNRALVSQGLKILTEGRRLGLSTLASVAGVEEPGTATACGFFLGPRLNAGGRIAKAELGLRLLMTRDVVEARHLAEELDAVNARRRDVEAAILTKAIEQAENQISLGAKVIFVHDVSWHVGVVGIVASRLKERFHCPILVGAESDGIVKGSARSVAGYDIGLDVINARQKGLLISGGGHAMAAGFSVAVTQVDAFRVFLDASFARQITKPTVATLSVDAIIALRMVSTTLAKEIAQLAPFGAGNDEPVLAISRVRCVKSDRIGRDGATLRVIMQDEFNNRLKGLVFRAADQNFVSLLEDRSLPLLHVAGVLKCDAWQGRESLTFFICDAALVRA